jgi:hypothetical protein
MPQILHHLRICVIPTSGRSSAYFCNLYVGTDLRGFVSATMVISESLKLHLPDQFKKKILCRFVQSNLLNFENKMSFLFTTCFLYDHDYRRLNKGERKINLALQGGISPAAIRFIWRPTRL